MKPSLMLNMIVKNEAARVVRCLSSVAPYIKSYSILDTGSTDDTPKIIQEFMDNQEIAGRIHYGEFRNFSQARNEAFALARGDNFAGDVPWCQFALLMDADMVLEVTDPQELFGLDANAVSYNMQQTAGTTSYANRRILNLGWGLPPYKGVTHEYIDAPAAGSIKGAHFIDHADGANRENKAFRDIALLEQGLAQEPKNERYMYYLANSYRDAGMYDKAAEMYEKRIAAGGWDEEVHSAMMNLGWAHKESLNFGGFIDAMLQAYNHRPTRVEPLYELAKAYRERDQQRIGAVFAKVGLDIKRPDDLLFVNDFAYSHGCRYEYSILGYYNEVERPQAFAITNDLALDPTCPADTRASARKNLYWYLEPLNHYCPSFTPKRIDFTPPDGYTAMNPSVEEHNGKIKCNIRCVNYKINGHGQYMIGEKGCQDAPIDTRNFLANVDVDLRVKDTSEILWKREPAKFNMVTGLEDVRLFRYRGSLCFTACVREQAATGVPQQIRGVLDCGSTTRTKGCEILSDDTAIEKNWMPVYNTLDVVYRLDKTRVSGDVEVKDAECPIYCGEISGGSQLLPFKSGYIAVVHEASEDPTSGKRTYWHRFAWFTMDLKCRRVSLPFVFMDRQIEFCCGIAYHPNHNDLILSFGVRDAEAWLATVAIEEIARMCWKFQE